MTAPMYRKRPTVVEAVRFRGSSTQAGRIDRWIAGEEYVEPGIETRDMTTIDVVTASGSVCTAWPGDYIIKDQFGNFEVCAQEDFADQYDPC